MPKLYAAVHHHANGMAVRLFLFSLTKQTPMLAEEELVKHLKINYRPDKGESLDICDANDMIDLDAAMGCVDSPIVQKKHEYVVHGGVKCLFCGSDDIEGSSFETDTGLARQRVACHVCWARWKDVYGLIDVEEICEPTTDAW